MDRDRCGLAPIHATTPRQDTRTQRSSSVVTPTRVPSLLLSPRVRGIRFTIRSTEAQASRRFSSRRLVRATSARHRIRHGKVYAAEWRAWRGHCQVNEPGPGCGELLRGSGRGHLGPHGEGSCAPPPMLHRPAQGPTHANQLLHDPVTVQDPAGRGQVRRNRAADAPVGAEATGILRRAWSKSWVVSWVPQGMTSR